MLNVKPILDLLVSSLSKENYKKSLTSYHFWFKLGQTYSQIPPGLVFDTIQNHANNLRPPDDFIFLTPPLILRFAKDAESSHLLGSHSAGLLNCLCTSILREFFDFGVEASSNSSHFSTDHIMNANFIAHCANLGYIDEIAIRDHILQSLTDISPPSLLHHLTDTLIILFKIAGATFTSFSD